MSQTGSINSFATFLEIFDNFWITTWKISLSFEEAGHWTEQRDSKNG